MECEQPLSDFSEEVQVLFDQCLANALIQRHRLICHIQLTEPEAIGLAQKLLLKLDTEDAVWVDNSHMQAIKQYRNQLGTEASAVIFNAYEGLNPDLLGIAQGWVRAGGLFILISPPENDWPSVDDPDYQRLDSSGEIPKPLKFIQHCVNVLQDAPIIRVTDGYVHFPTRESLPPSALSGTEQAKLIQEIERFIERDRRESIVISAARGRGKSTAIGRALSGFLNNSDKRIGICALSQSASGVIFDELARGGNESKDRLFNQCFFPVDKLVNEKPSLDLLVVDEAAAIPVSLLMDLVGTYPKILFATTTEGYEGHGQGFAIRFEPFLKRHFRHFAKHTLEEPIRFAPNDPLESLMADLLLLKQPERVAIPEGEKRIRWLDQAALIKNPFVLKQVYGLLVEAHYQTRCDDLRILIDHPGLTLVICEQEGFVIGVVMLFAEGGFDSKHIVELTQRPRRVRGHLTAQALHHTACEGSLEATYLRISRIAVHADFRREGLGSQMLDFIARSDEVQSDFLSTSFSLETALVSFWQKNDFHFVKLGVKQNNATGLFSGILVRPLKTQSQPLLTRWQAVFHSSLLYQLFTQNQSVPAELMGQLMKGGRWSILECHNQQRLAFIQNRLAFDQCRYALVVFLLNQWGEKALSSEKREIGLALIEVLIKNASLSIAAKKAKLNGKNSLIVEAKTFFNDDEVQSLINKRMRHG